MLLGAGAMAQTVNFGSNSPSGVSQTQGALKLLKYKKNNIRVLYLDTTGVAVDIPFDTLQLKSNISQNFTDNSTTTYPSSKALYDGLAGKTDTGYAYPIAGVVTGNNSTMAGSGQWQLGSGTVTWNVNSTVANKLYFTTSTGGYVRLPVLKTGKYYKVTMKIALNSGTVTNVLIGNYTATSGAWKIRVRPSSTETQYTFVFKALTNHLDFGITSGDNNGSAYTLDDVTAYEMSDAEIANTNFNDVRTWAAVGDSVTDDQQAVLNLFNWQSENGVVNREILFKDGIYKITDLTTLSTFTNMVMKGENSVIKSSIAATSPKYMFSIATGVDLTIDGLKFNINSDTMLLNCIRVVGTSGTLTIRNCEFYNFQNTLQRAIYLQSVTKNPSLGLSNTVPSPLITNCKFYNQQQVNIPSYNYTTSTFKGCAIQLGLAAEYVQITNCNFFGISEALRSDQGANGTFTNCIVEQCDPSQVSTTAGVVNIINTANNNGKWTITDNHFNHNLGYGIYSLYAGADRGNIISNNQFLVNSYTAIHIENGGYNIISDNIFNRLNEQQGVTGFPYSSSMGVGIELVNTLGNVIQDNYFNSSMRYGVTSSGTSDGNILANNTFRAMTVGETNMVGAGNIISPLQATRSSASTLTLVYAGDYTFTGTTATYTLPAIVSTVRTRSQAINVKNAGSGVLTVNTNGGLNTLFTSTLVNTLAVMPGESYSFRSDGTNFQAE